MKKLPVAPGIIFDIQRCSFHNGPGIRTTVFLKGCPLCCQWRHNPESRDFAPHLSFKPACPAAALKILGVRMTVAEVMTEVVRDVDYCKASGGGISVSGGEPLAQFHFTLALLKTAQAKGLHTALETCGAVAWEQLGDVLTHTDLVRYDLKHMDSAEHQRLTGMPNDRIISNFFSSNRLARSQHDRLGLAYQPGDQFPPPAEMMQQLKCVVEQSGVTCVVD